MTEKLIIPTAIADVEIDEEHEDVVVEGAADSEMPWTTRITVDGKPVKTINFKRNPAP